MKNYHLFRKIIAAILSNILMCWIIVPLLSKKVDLNGSSISFVFFLYFFASLPFFLIGGVPYSIIIDRIWLRLDNRVLLNWIYRFLINILVYGLGGFIIFGSFIFLIGREDAIESFESYIPFLKLSLSGAVMAYLIDELLAKIGPKLSISNNEVNHN